MGRTLVVKTPTAKVVGWLGIAFSSFMVIGWSSGVEADLLMYSLTLAFFCLGVACVVLSGPVEMARDPSVTGPRGLITRWNGTRWSG